MTNELMREAAGAVVNGGLRRTSDYILTRSWWAHWRSGWEREEGGEGGLGEKERERHEC